ncbi:MAG: pyroglutamyl-peptidase I [Clostridia bacterium]|nr:pyroglutamyl-peptidase I [Clostridia bacterium]
MKILITGFEPMYRYWNVNPSWEAVSRLPDEIGGAEIIKLRLPIVFSKATELLERHIAELRPDAVVSVGQSGAANCIQIERIGVNINDCHGVPDNDEDAPQDRIIREDGDAAYFCTLPTRKMIETLRAHGIPADLSEHAGCHLCNHATYTAAYLRAKKYPHMRTGFIHVPFLRSQCLSAGNKRYTMELDVTVRALELALETLASEL